MTEQRELPIPKHVRVWMEALRTTFSAVSAVGTVLVILRVFGVL